ncbi:MAG: hypothetical protein OEM91_10610 [Hyphomicrobiales bacterium]|nr:hypothetical protein [Hyphomicrobiales bacterium]
MSRSPDRVEKVMALTLADFHRSLVTLAPGLALRDGQTEIEIDIGGAGVSITFEEQQETMLGGLLALPRARVTLELDGLDNAQRAAFLARFDRAFQRGGG